MKYVNLNMDRVQYEGHDYESYSLSAQTVNEVLEQGNIPEITLVEKNTDKLNAIYNLGINDAQEKLEIIKNYLENKVYG